MENAIRLRDGMSDYIDALRDLDDIDYTVDSVTNTGFGLRSGRRGSLTGGRRKSALDATNNFCAFYGIESLTKPRQRPKVLDAANLGLSVNQAIDALRAAQTAAGEAWEAMYREADCVGEELVIRNSIVTRLNSANRLNADFNGWLRHSVVRLQNAGVADAMILAVAPERSAHHLFRLFEQIRMLQDAGVTPEYVAAIIGSVGMSSGAHPLTGEPTGGAQVTAEQIIDLYDSGVPLEFAAAMAGGVA